MSTVMDPDRLRRTAKARDRFLGGDHELPNEDDSKGVRSVIAKSWMRSAQFGVDPTRRELPLKSSIGSRTKLLRCAQPILEDMSRHLADMSTALLLADRDGIIIGRWVGQQGLSRLMDRTNSAPGFSLSEEVIGTNGLGSVIEELRPYAVIGPEHYADLFVDYACFGAPIVHPRTGRMEGVLTFVCRVKDSSPLMLPFVATTSAQVAERITSASERHDKRAIHEFRAATRNSSQPTLMFGDNYVIANAQGADLLSEADPEVLWNLAHRENAGSVGNPVELSRGRQAFATYQPVVDEDLEVGTLVCLVLAESSEPGPDRPDMRTELLGELRDRVCAHDSVWDPLLDPVLNAVDLQVPVLIAGERGTGKAEFARTLHECTTASDPLIILNADLADISGTRRWLASARESLQERGTILIEHVNALDEHSAEILATLIEEAVREDPRQVLSTLAGDPDVVEIHQNLQDILAGHVITLPRMQERTGDLSCLMYRFAEQLGVPPLQLTPYAMQTLHAYSWPGNLKQLKRFVQTTRTANPHGATDLADLPSDMQMRECRRLGEIERLERQAIVNALARCHGNKSTAAEELGVSRATLYRKIKSYRLA